jgi:hypothetical protein
MDDETRQAIIEYVNAKTGARPCPFCDSTDWMESGLTFFGSAGSGSAAKFGALSPAEAREIQPKIEIRYKGHVDF